MILLECGLFQNNNILESYKVNSEKFKFDPEDLDYVFLNHPHIDHCGNIPRLFKQGFRGKVITNSICAEFTTALLKNCNFILDSEARMLSKKYSRDYTPLYSEEDVYKTLDHMYCYDGDNTIFELDDTVSFQWIENSHCLGSKQLQLILKDELGVSFGILYTSDIGALKTQNHYVKDTVIPTMHNKISIMESTYGETGRINKKNRKYDVELLKTAIQTTLERKGSVILPAFSYSRTQELLTNLYESFYGDPEFKTSIVVDSKLSCEVSEIYSKVLKECDSEEWTKLWEKVSTWDRVKFISEKEESQASVRDKTPKIVITSSGFCTNGRVLNYLQEYLKDTNSMIIFSGYCGADNSYLAYRIKNGKENKVININKIPVPNKADCKVLSTFSSHANREDLIKYGSSLNTEKLVLVHGSTQAKNDLASSLREAISKEDKSHRIIVSNKDMYMAL